ncbi:hypothetical protein [Chroococcidiopsis sp. CCNUC1]|uniref:hypothetical protein n=1 Tax=Chroococcidiopsis sp. CCNUC1 TaxID=2653189 RepID=UPI00201FDB51|nr:hypothetical protein [Chroococcidiopsis sp. CCNUC1]URD50935.1 hypothetical protein M5J74_02865 [Chroococcidiopsis sp. CCNUC1]
MSIAYFIGSRESVEVGFQTRPSGSREEETRGTRETREKLQVAHSQLIPNSEFRIPLTPHPCKLAGGFSGTTQ